MPRMWKLTNLQGVHPMTTDDLLSKATDRPWRSDHFHNSRAAVMTKGCEQVVATLGYCNPSDPDGDLTQEYTANAALIVRAVNSLPAFLKMAKQLTEESDRGREWISEDTIDQAVLALRLAEGGAQ